MESWAEVKKEWLNDSHFKRAYESLDLKYQVIGQLIELRHKQCLTQADLAKKLGTKQSAIARLESGNYNPSLKLLEKIAKATGSRLMIQFR